MSLPAPLTQFIRAIRWHRRAIGIAAAVVCLFATLSALSPAQPPSAPVLVAARRLPAGTLLEAADLTVTTMPVAYRPDAALAEAGQAVGRTLTGALSAGSVLTELSILGGRAGDTAADERLVPFRVPDAATVSLLRVGDRITVVGASVDGAAVELAAGVRVAALPEITQNNFGGEQGALVVVAAAEPIAARLAAASSQMRMAIVLG